MGVTIADHRARILQVRKVGLMIFVQCQTFQAVGDLVVGGATQVYIRAAALKWQMLEENKKRDIPKNLLKKMVRMKIKTEDIRLTEYSPKQQRNLLPLVLAYLSHRYSLSLNTFQENIEIVLEELWKEEWEKQCSIQPESPYENFSSHKSPSLFSTFQQQPPHTRLVRRWL